MTQRILVFVEGKDKADRVY
ncbi:hypothetical protein [Peribacillus sp. SCS-155]